MAKKPIEQFDEKNDEQVYVSVRETLECARGKVERAVNSAMVEAYWEIGRQIVEATGERGVWEASGAVSCREADGGVWEGVYSEKSLSDAAVLSGVSKSAHAACTIELDALSQADAYSKPKTA